MEEQEMITNLAMLIWLLSPPPIPDLSFLAEVKPPVIIEIKAEKKKVKL
jgi:hypothetical protein